MATIVTRSGKGGALTWAEADANFTNLNTDKIEAATTNTLTNKSIDLSTNTLTGTLAQFNTAVTDANLVSLTGSETLTNKTIDLASNTITGTLTQFNTAVSNADLASLDGSETLTNKTILAATNIVQARSAPDTSQFSFRNKLINGGGLISQRGISTALTAGGVYGADRWIHLCSGATGITATCAGDVSGLSGTRSKNYVYTQGSWTSGQPGFIQRIESVNVFDLNGKQVTFSGKIYQNTGSSITFNLQIYKPNALNDWSASTQISTTQTVVVPSGTVTPFTATWTLGSTDASNGLDVRVLASASVTVSSKIVAITDMQLEEGSIATPFENRPVGLELFQCQRYYTTIPYSWIAYAPSGNGFGTYQSLPSTMRITPTITTTPTTTTNITSFGIYAVNNIYIFVSGTATTSASCIATGNITASAEL